MKRSVVENGTCYIIRSKLIAFLPNLQRQIYVDEYKGQIYYAIGTVDPHLKSIITNDMKSRFHACDHVIRCQTCRKGKGKIVEIHWAEVMVAAFPVKHQRVVEACLRAKEGKGEWPRYLVSRGGGNWGWVPPRQPRLIQFIHVSPSDITRRSTFSTS